MRLVDLWNSSTKPTISFELFPPKTEKAAGNLESVIDTLVGEHPDFVSVTFGAGGSTREGSRQLIRQLKEDKGLSVVPYFACYGLSPDEITAVLDDYQALGVETILAVRGDKPQEETFEPHPESLPYALDLVAFIRDRYDFCVGVAGYPEGHIDAVSQAKDLEFLKRKVDMGAEFIITNYFYDNVYFFDFVERCNNAGIDVPVLPGVMPIYSVKMMEMLAGMCGATITNELRAGIDSLDEGDRDALLEFGIEYATQKCEELLGSGVRGLHFYTMDRSKSTIGILKRIRAGGAL